MHAIKIPQTVSTPLSTFVVVEVQVKWSLRSLSLLMFILKVTFMLDKTSYGSLCVRSWVGCGDRRGAWTIAETTL